MKPTSCGLPPRGERLLAAAQLAIGAVATLAPNQVARTVAGRTVPAPSWVVRLLGARMVGQGLFLVVYPDRRTQQAGATVDGLHAASMLAAAVWLRPYRRSSLLSAAVAASAAVAGVWLARS